MRRRLQFRQPVRDFRCDCRVCEIDLWLMFLVDTSLFFTLLLTILKTPLWPLSRVELCFEIESTRVSPNEFCITLVRIKRRTLGVL